jgi:3-carboxy-cis,cis-muconate cycloisomerase
MSAAFDHPWLSGLLGDAEAAAIWSPERQLRHMLRVEAALARALGACGAAEAGAAERAARAVEAARPDMAALAQGTARDGVPVPALLRGLRAVAGGEAEAGAIHAGATSQDVIDTALALTLDEATTLALDRLAALEADLGALEARFGAARIMGRTRMQAALPIAAATRIGAWRAPLADHRARLEAARPRIARLQLGGPVGDRAAWADRAPAVAAHMAAALGLADAAPWHARRDGVVEHGQIMALIAGSTGKMGQDLALMAQQGVDEVALSGAGGSSAMAHKANPVAAETLVALGRYAAGQSGLLAQALLHEQERSGAAWTLEWMVLPGLSRAGLRALSGARALVAAIERIGPG